MLLRPPNGDGREQRDVQVQSSKEKSRVEMYIGNHHPMVTEAGIRRLRKGGVSQWKPLGFNGS